MAGFAVSNDEIVQKAAKQEVIRRYYKACCDYLQGNGDISTKEKIELLMGDLGITPDDRKVAVIAREKSNDCGVPVVALELPNGKIVTGKKSNLLSASSAVLLNAIKELANISDDINLISPLTIEPILKMKKELLKEKYDFLTLEEMLIALSIGAVTNPTAAKAMSKVKELFGCEAHGSCILPVTDETVIKKLGINITTEAVFGSNNLYNL